jgi:hypothetical protein
MKHRHFFDKRFIINKNFLKFLPVRLLDHLEIQQLK